MKKRHFLGIVLIFDFSFNRTRSDLVLRREKRNSLSSSNGNKKDWGLSKNNIRGLNPSNSNGTMFNDNKAQLLNQLPASTKVETILKTEPLDPESQNQASGSHSYIGGDGGGMNTDFFPDIETPGSAMLTGGGVSSLEDDEFLSSIQPVVGGQPFNPNSNANNHNIKKEVDMYNEYQVSNLQNY